MATAPHPTILSVGRALPPHYASQDAISAAFREQWGSAHYNLDRLEELHRAVQVRGRHLARPLADYAGLDTFARRNDAWIAAALELGEAAVRDALDRAGVGPRDVDHLFFVTTTGIATPSIDARLAGRLGLRADVRRSPLFGLGCAGGAAGTARAADWLRGRPDGLAVVLAVEICSLTLQRDDLSIPNLIAAGLFGDGAAAVVLAGAARPEGAPPRGNPPRPRVVASRAVLYPDTERVMGWDVVDTGFKIVLSARVPEVVAAHIGGDVDGFLGDCGLGRADIRHWLAHTGGPRVLQAFAAALGLDDGALRRSWSSLAEVGNLSSASVLFVLRDLFDAGEAEPGEHGLMIAMGPGFGAELVLLRY